MSHTMAPPDHLDPMQRERLALLQERLHVIQVEAQHRKLLAPNVGTGVASLFGTPGQHLKGAI